MVQKNLKQILFILFDEHLLTDVVKLYEKYDYLITDNDVKVIYNISKIYTETETDDVIKHLNALKTLESSETFPDILMLRCKLAYNCHEKNILTYDKLLSLFNKKDLDKALNDNPVVYNTPAYYRITINGNDFDDNLNNINKCLKYLDDKVIFRANVEKIDKPSYKNYLKVRHSLEVADYEYGFEAIKNLQELFYINKLDTKINKNNFKELISDYIIILEFMNAYQITGKKFTNTIQYFTLKKMFSNIILELSVDALLIGEVKKENVLKMLAETKKRLKEDIGYDDEELKKFMEPIFQRIKDSNQISG